MGGGGAFIATTLCRRRSGSAEKSAAPRRRRRRGSWTASASCRSSCPRRRSPRTPTAPASASSSRSPATHTTPDQSGTQDHIPGYCICNTNIFLRRFSLKKISVQFSRLKMSLWSSTGTKICWTNKISENRSRSAAHRVRDKLNEACSTTEYTLLWSNVGDDRPI